MLSYRLSSDLLKLALLSLYLAIMLAIIQNHLSCIDSAGCLRELCRAALPAAGARRAPAIG